MVYVWNLIHHKFEIKIYDKLKQNTMGRSFKLQPRSQPKKKNIESKEEEVKVVYDHRPQVKTNPKIIAEFMKNSLIPSELWDGPTEHEKLYAKIMNK